MPNYVLQMFGLQVCPSRDKFSCLVAFLKERKVCANNIAVNAITMTSPYRIVHCLCSTARIWCFSVLVLVSTTLPKHWSGIFFLTVTAAKWLVTVFHLSDSVKSVSKVVPIINIFTVIQTEPNSACFAEFKYWIWVGPSLLLCKEK